MLKGAKLAKAHTLLAPVLAQRTPFRLLELIGEAIGAGPLETTSAFLASRGRQD